MKQLPKMKSSVSFKSRGFCDLDKSHTVQLDLETLDIQSFNLIIKPFIY